MVNPDWTKNLVYRTDNLALGTDISHLLKQPEKPGENRTTGGGTEIPGFGPEILGDGPEIWTEKTRSWTNYFYVLDVGRCTLVFSILSFLLVFDNFLNVSYSFKT